MHTFKRNAGDESACASRVGVRLRTLVAASTWLHIVLPIGLGLPPSANAAGPETVTYIHTDALGSLVAESDANGNVIKRYDYEPYGTLVGGQVTDGPGYTGHVSDSTTGLSYMQQRYMDPELGVFLSVDPVSAYDQPVGQFNRYRYANGNPYKFTDPDGRNPALPFIYGAIAGGLSNIAIQKLMNPDKPIDQTQALIAAGVGSVSGGVGGIAVAAVESGVISVGRAVAIQAAANFVTGGAGAAAESALKGEPISAGGVLTAATGGAVGGLAGSGVAAAAGDFAGPAAKGALNRLSSSASPGAPNIASTTASTGVAIPRQSITQAGASQLGQSTAGAAVDAAQKTMEKKK
ncbi:RHS repeat-associated core domain-containing protein [Stenotrophomonas muris]|uniref:RHS repeat-associated core domain-containing protein n=1 Tax=Stenotrophomonas muris TaxID=2963283 RepID=UPI00383B3D60